MKQFDDFTRDDLWKLRSQVVLGSIFVHDYRNDMGISARSACGFFDGYADFLQELAGEPDEPFAWYRLDSPEHLEQWFLCFDDFSWVEYDADPEEPEPVIVFSDENPGGWDEKAWLEYQKTPGKLIFRPK